MPPRIKVAAILLTCFSINIVLKGQNKQFSYDRRLKMNVYSFVEKPPSFPGGDVALNSFLRQITIPAGEAPTQGKINLSFVVDTAGNLIDKGIMDKRAAEYSLLEKNALALLDKMPKWIPGVQRGKKVAVRIFIPVFISFQK
jgi:protein TonB